MKNPNIKRGNYEKCKLLHMKHAHTLARPCGAAGNEGFSPVEDEGSWPKPGPLKMGRLPPRSDRRGPGNSGAGEKRD